MILRTDVNVAELQAFLKTTQYPCVWSEDVLAHCCHLTRIDSPCGGVAGYVWFMSLPGTFQKVQDMHIALDPRFRGKAITRSVIKGLMTYVCALGAQSVIARPLSQADAQLLLRFGFDFHGPFAVFKFP